MNGMRIAGAIGLAAMIGAANADEPLSCRIERGELSGASAEVVRLDFTWSTTHQSTEPTGPIHTSIGLIDQAEGPRYTTAMTLNGRTLAIPAQLTGLIRFGTAYDAGGRVALAYLLEREGDASATPSQAVVVLDAAGNVIESEVLAGDAPASGGHCVLIQ
ncbi:hypothetical protein E2F46_06340 [Luteimonas aestuarii]|uniref:Uncharacterized protein n=1 Tax=Luteimonas aestuarii TaxID=453837 RepID=A0A4R5TYD6_9GAMM|nr:hypothetical protein [Luteimonas aestuarii]TDK26213.1 hypothetical protein E2F46_06340 [Luteimonas aestuarii]